MYTLSPSTPPMRGLRRCEKLHSPIGRLQFSARTMFLDMRWLENQTYSNETVALLAPEINSEESENETKVLKNNGTGGR